MKKLIYLTLFLSVLIAPGCSKVDDFLGEAPSKTTAIQIKSIDQLEQLLNNYVLFSNEINYTAAQSTDDSYITKELHSVLPFSIAVVQFSLWDVEYTPLALRATLWSNEYRKIFTANTVLTYLDKVKGGTPEQRANLNAEAHLIRAYSYWILANTFCLPYTDANKNEPGLPLKFTLSFEENVERQSLQKVYEQIEADLAAALKITVPLVQGGRPIHWRANKAAVNGFAARYWLNRFDYAKALQYANAAMAEYSTLVNYNTEMKFGIPRSLTLNAGTAQQSSFTIEYPYTHNNQSDFTDMLGWKEFMYFRMLANESFWYLPSPDLLALYDQANDLRYKYHIVEGYSYDRGMVKPSYDYPGYIFFYKDKMPSGPTTAEMLLIKAEALAHSGQSGPAMDALNLLRAKRMVPGSWVNLTAVNNEDAMKKVVEERRREMPFAQRWFDLRRYNHNEYAGDDVTLSRTFYPFTLSTVLTNQPVQIFTLPKNSRKWAAPLPNSEIISGMGIIKQNTY